MTTKAPIHRPALAVFFLFATAQLSKASADTARADVDVVPQALVSFLYMFHPWGEGNVQIVTEDGKLHYEAWTHRTGFEPFAESDDSDPPSLIYKARGLHPETVTWELNPKSDSAVKFAKALAKDLEEPDMRQTILAATQLPGAKLRHRYDLYILPQRLAEHLAKYPKYEWIEAQYLDDKLGGTDKIRAELGGEGARAHYREQTYVAKSSPIKVSAKKAQAADEQRLAAESTLHSAAAGYEGQVGKIELTFGRPDIKSHFDAGSTKPSTGDWKSNLRTKLAHGKRLFGKR